MCDEFVATIHDPPVNDSDQVIIISSFPACWEDPDLSSLVAASILVSASPISEANEEQYERDCECKGRRCGVSPVGPCTRFEVRHSHWGTVPERITQRQGQDTGPGLTSPTPITRLRIWRLGGFESLAARHSVPPVSWRGQGARGCAWRFWR
jgi:hypothetical protein